MFICYSSIPFQLYKK